LWLTRSKKKKIPSKNIDFSNSYQHQAVLRCLYAYFMNIDLEEVPYIKMELHTLIVLTPNAYGCFEERIELLPGSNSNPVKKDLV